MARVSMKAPAYPPAAQWIPPSPNLGELGRAMQDCRACPLWENATQAVPGEGLRRARLMLVGEVPGNEEDLSGRPFVGPAGRMLDECLIEAGVERGDAFLTNTVKHFKFVRRGPRRIHQSPGSVEISACLPWLDAEVEIVRPEVLVCLGATAAKALIGAKVRITRDHGQVFTTRFADWTMPTYHPSALLRGPDPESRAALRRILVEDLARVAERLREDAGQPVAVSR